MTQKTKLNESEFPFECPFCHKPMGHGTTPARSVVKDKFGYHVHCSHCGYSSAVASSPEEAIRVHNELVGKVMNK